MSAAIHWRPVLAQLDRFAETGRKAALWLRDDDAVAPSAALEQLIGLCERFAVPLLLAVIPKPARPELAVRLAAAPSVAPCQHGFQHCNHAPANEKKREFGVDRPYPIMRDEIRTGRDMLRALFGESLRAIFVPPWNRLDPLLAGQLPALGFAAISTFGHKSILPGGPPRAINCHLDIIDWRGGGASRQHDDLVRALAAELALSFEGGKATGVLTHHLVHDANAWAFLEELFAMTVDHPGADWMDVDRLLARP